jgi:adenylate kinase family enzyme
MHRVSVVGPSGSGKTTVGRRLAELLDVTFVELDALHWGPNWSQASAEELRASLAGALGGRKSWVIDGSYYSKLGDLVLRQADTAVWLDLPLHICLVRLWHRTVRRIRDDEELWAGNRESWRGAFWGRESLFWWTIHHYRRGRRVWPERFARLPNLTVVRLGSPGEVEAWLATPSVPSEQG